MYIEKIKAISKLLPRNPFKIWKPYFGTMWPTWLNPLCVEFILFFMEVFLHLSVGGMCVSEGICIFISVLCIKFHIFRWSGRFRCSVVNVPNGPHTKFKYHIDTLIVLSGKKPAVSLPYNIRRVEFLKSSRSW